MPFVSDTFTHLFDWILDPQRQEKIVNARLEAEFDGIDTGLSAVAARATAAEGNITALEGRVDDIGEYVESVVAIGSAVSLTSGNAANLTSISLTAGDWDVSFNMIFNPAAGTTVVGYAGAANTTSATLPSFGSPNRIDITGNSVANFVAPMALSAQRFSLGSTTTMFAVARASFAVSTMSVCGILSARRMSA